MVKIRQLPELFLRGSLANETMKNLTPDQKKETEGIVAKLIGHPELAAHRNKFRSTLRCTIAGDYDECDKTADQEFHIAVWRAVVYLLYHTDYQFKCTLCNATEYQAQTGKMQPFNRRVVFCPVCEYGVVAEDHDQYKIGSKIKQDEYELMLDKYPQQPISVVSSIESLPGPHKVNNAQQVLSDPIQIKKFFGEFVWNYFRQMLLENKITTHARQQEKIVGPADVLAVEAVLSALREHKVKHTYCQHTNPEQGQYCIQVDALSTPPDFSAQYCCILTEFAEHGVKITSDCSRIMIGDLKGSSPIVDTNITRIERVSTIGKSKSSNDDTEHAIQTDEIISQETGTLAVDTQDVLQTIREALPDGHTKSIFDIFIKQGEAYEKFSRPKKPKDAPEPAETEENPWGYGDGDPKANHIGKHLGCNAKQVETAIKHIKVQCYRQGLALI